MISAWVQLMNQFAQNMDQFSHYIESLSQRLARIKHQTHAEKLESLEPSDPNTCPVLLTEVLDELAISIERLKISQSEIQQQHQELFHARLELEVERQRYQELFELAPDGYLVTDHEGRISEANQAIAKLFNVSQHSLVGKHIVNYIASGHHGLFRQGLNALEKDDRAHEWIVCVQPYQQQKVLDAALTVTTVRDRQGNLIALRWLFRDITERKQAEEAILQAKLAEITNRELEKEITERRQLESTLRQQTQALLEANRLKDDFLAIVSHELRSPLNAILGWAQLLRSRKFDEAITARALETIERNARSQKQLIEDLLDISRIIRGKLRLNICPINLTAVIVAAVDNVQPAADAKALQVEVIFPPNLGLVAGDPDRLQQVIWNLLSNSVKFTPNGGQITIELKVKSAAIEIIISDTGQGIEPELLPFIFDHFRQGESANTRHHGGLGLGLSIVRHLLEMHGGTIQATSSGLNQGSTFIVRLPTINSDNSEHTPEYMPFQIMEIESEAPFQISPQLEHICVLVVDNDADARKLVTVFLEQCGAKVQTVGSAREALAAIQHSKPDVLVCDSEMPDEDGFSLIRTIRKLETKEIGLIPAIALSTYTGEEERIQALLAGFQIHLGKPIEPNNLVKAIARLVGRSEQLFNY